MYYAGSYNCRYRRGVIRLLFAVMAGIVLLLSLYKLIVYIAVLSNAESGDKGVFRAVASWCRNKPEEIMRAAMPLPAQPGGETRTPRFASPSYLVEPVIAMFMVDRQSPVRLIQSQIPFLAEEPFPGPGDKQDTVAVTSPEAEMIPPGGDEEESSRQVPLSDECLVAIYNTHTGETYALTDGVERLHGKRGGVVKVSQALQEELEKRYGIRVARSDAINDANYGESYIKSQETLRKLLEENPSVQVVLDIHRDAGLARENSLATVDGREVAPVLIVVGSDARAPFPGWRQNYDFARELAAEIEKQYPGLCIGVRIKEGRYNQFMHPRAVLLEVGSVSNSTEEAVQTGRLLAGPVAKLVKRYLDAENSEHD